MTPRTRYTACFSLGITVSLAFFLGISSSNPASTGDPEAFTIANLLDPTFASRDLCGHQGAQRGIFFRPETLLALAPAAHAAEVVPDDVPLLKGLSGHHRAITTSKPQAQAYFDQGMALLFGFNHWETCAICYWAEAFAHGPNINAPMEEAAVEPAFAAISKAQALKQYASDPERVLIEAMALRYSPDKSADRGPLDKAYSDAMEAAYLANPEDQDVATFYAESLMDLSPWDYWERDFRTPKPHIAKAIAAVEKILADNPDHAGAIHLYIHLTEPSRTPERAEPYADRLAALLPAAGHLVHMPGHTYFRIGRYLDSLATNVKAVEADEAYLAQTQGSDIYRYGYYPHNVHFVLVSAQMAGDSKTTIKYANKLDALIPMDSVTEAPWIQPIKAAPYFAQVQFGEAKDVMALEEPPASLPYLKAMWHYARGVAFAQNGDSAGAAGEAVAIAALGSAPEVLALDEQDVPASDVLRLAGLLVEARINQAQDKPLDAITKINQAITIQNGLPYTEPPYWYYPVQQTLGAVLLSSGQAGEAVTAFRDSLMIHPNNAWSLYGLMKAEEVAGDPALPVTKDLFDKAAVEKGDIPMDRL
jgi:tetratricopeptide (TPR) repeat protein